MARALPIFLSTETQVHWHPTWSITTASVSVSMPDILTEMIVPRALDLPVGGRYRPIAAERNEVERNAIAAWT